MDRRSGVKITARQEQSTPASDRNGGVDPIIELQDVDIYYGSYRAVRGVSIPIERREITAMIGPSGCGKSTLLRSLNRMNDLIIGARVTGRITFHGQDLYEAGVDPIEVRRRIGMVFQQPNPFPKSIYDNISYGPKVTGMKVSNMDDLVEEALTGAALWGEVKDKLKTSALALSGGQQQRLCIARTIAVKPEVILMDEPCSALDPIATAKIEDLMAQLTKQYTIVIVTHNMQQAARVSDKTAFLTAEVDKDGQRHGVLIEFDDTNKIFSAPSNELTEAYISGRFG
ncbi:MAG: phosphate ABC transporter ATP-binding protein [Geodermatophilaceae bacterium]|nr:phosphate ABC transporter ATP-binding protein [Geodermatophilaceae bacterium]